eukprot:jgi/Chrzof1/15015/Cz09g24020.t1
MDTSSVALTWVIHHSGPLKYVCYAPCTGVQNNRPTGRVANFFASDIKRGNLIPKLCAASDMFFMLDPAFVQHLTGM